MKVRVLIENTCERDDLLKEHGLSLLIKTNERTILFDSGRSDAFIHNSKRMGIDLSTVDFAVLSHGHYDHGGGLDAFFHVNQKATVYCHQKAFNFHFSRQASGTFKAIGLNDTLLNKRRFEFVNQTTKLSDHLWIFVANTKTYDQPILNRYLFQEDEDRIFRDDFEHEINLVVEENHKFYLFAGCAHKGIVPILKDFNETFGCSPARVFSGFHLTSGSLNLTAAPRKVDDLAYTLRSYPTLFDTCHCTGLEPYERMKKVMGDQIHYYSTGAEIDY